MSWLKGLQLGTYLIGAPGAAGTAAHFLSANYNSLMNFDGQFYIVKAITKLYDPGIPEIPESIKSSVEKIVQHLNSQSGKGSSRRRRSLQDSGASSSTGQYLKIPDSIPAGTDTTQVSLTSSAPKRRAKRQAAAAAAPAPSSSTQTEVFKDKKYWCRYFDYSRGPKHVIMEYDRNCVVYNIFDVKGTATNSSAAQVAQTAASPSSSSTATTDNKEGKTYDIENIKGKQNGLENSKLNSNNDYQKGAFYLLSIDKSKITRINTLTHIELTETGTERFPENVYQKKITTLSIKAPLRGNAKDISLSFIEGSLPSSVLLLKKVNSSSATSQAAQTAATTSTGSGSGGKDDEKTYMFEHASGGSSEKLQVLGMWEFPPVSKEKADPTKLDLRFLDKVDYNNIGKSRARRSFLWGDIMDIFRFLESEESERYFISKTLSDFWKYKVGDKIKLYEETVTSATAQSSVSTVSQASSGTTGAASSSTSKKELAEFEVVSGLLMHLNSPLKCVPNSETSLGYLAYFDYKRNFANSGNKKVYSIKDNPTHCKPKEGIPPYTLIFLGTEKSKLKPSSSNGGTTRK